MNVITRVNATSPIRSPESPSSEQYRLSSAESSSSSAYSLPSPFSRPSSPVLPMDRISTASSDLITPSVFRFDVIPPTPPASFPVASSVREITTAHSLLQPTISIENHLSMAHDSFSRDSPPLPTPSDTCGSPDTLLAVPQCETRNSRTLSRTLTELLEGLEGLNTDCEVEEMSNPDLDEYQGPENDRRERLRSPSTPSLEQPPSETSSIHTPSISSEVETAFLPPQEHENQHTLRSKRSSYVLPRQQQQLEADSEPQIIVTPPETPQTARPEPYVPLETIMDLRIDPITPLDHCSTVSLGQLAVSPSVQTRVEAPPPYTQPLPQYSTIQHTESRAQPTQSTLPARRDSVSTMKHVPLRLSSISLPPARPLRRLLRTDLPRDDRSSRQWDREKVATDVRQVVQRLKWDKAQKAWQLVREAGQVPITHMSGAGSSHFPNRFSLQSNTSLQPIHEHRVIMESILPLGQLEWALVDTSLPVPTTSPSSLSSSQPVFRLCIAWRTSVSRNTFRHPFGAQDELRVFVLGRTKADFYELHEKLLEQYPLESRRHKWAQDHEIGPMALASIEAMDKPDEEHDRERSMSVIGGQWEVHREEMRREAERLERWLQSLLKLKTTRCAEALQSDLVRAWMSPRRAGDCERVTENWRIDSHCGEERIARALERVW
ncbi:hypothetical protein FRC17_003617 [Serendipita sp. 399]|nr:hypothetical protein FRC17_003617 [Serendipita sp. 399]